MAVGLARAGVAPNAISAAGLAGGLIAGGLLAGTSWVGGWAVGAFFLGAGLMIQGRLLCNLLDGMVAIEGGRRSRLGPIWNEVPDRVSDAAALIGAGYALGGVPWLGWLAAVGALMTAYVRAVGASNGVGEAFVGVMAKPKRMFWMTVACLVAAVGLTQALPLALGLIAMGCAWTCGQRLAWIAGRLPG